MAWDEHESPRFNAFGCCGNCRVLNATCFQCFDNARVYLMVEKQTRACHALLHIQVGHVGMNSIDKIAHAFSYHCTACKGFSPQSLSISHRPFDVQKLLKHERTCSKILCVRGLVVDLPAILLFIFKDVILSFNIVLVFI